ncbi:hypothetical protein [Actinocorallia lasiicapitis]
MAVGIMGEAPALAHEQKVLAQKEEAVESAIARQLQRTKGGKRSGKYEVSYRNGTVVMLFANERGQWPARSSLSRLHTEYRHGCPYGVTVRWACFYEHDRFNSGRSGARMLQFSQTGTQFLSDYDFNDQTTSWVNTNNNRVVVVYNNIGSNNQPNTQLWWEYYNSENSNVGTAANDKATAFTMSTCGNC